MGLFTRKQESKEQREDMKCWNCDKLISHKKVKWNPRKVGAPDGNVAITEQLQEFKKSIGNKEAIATPNQIFGLHEYEYRGKCPECHAELTCFWRGKDSFNKIQGVLFSPKSKPFHCNECEHIINREFQVWYSIRIQDEDKIKEYLVTICPKCNAEQGYPFEYELEKGIIE
jgi:Zn finger protein HypA/HybF involved in hydrogenase expression